MPCNSFSKRRFKGSGPDKTTTLQISTYQPRIPPLAPSPPPSPTLDLTIVVKKAISSQPLPSSTALKLPAPEREPELPCVYHALEYPDPGSPFEVNFDDLTLKTPELDRDQALSEPPAPAHATHEQFPGTPQSAPKHSNAPRHFSLATNEDKPTDSPPSTPPHPSRAAPAVPDAPQKPPTVPSKSGSPLPSLNLRPSARFAALSSHPLGADYVAGRAIAKSRENAPSTISPASFPRSSPPPHTPTRRLFHPSPPGAPLKPRLVNKRSAPSSFGEMGEYRAGYRSSPCPVRRPRPKRRCTSEWEPKLPRIDETDEQPDRPGLPGRIRTV